MDSSPKTWKHMNALWNKIPALIRGPVVGMAVLLVGLQPAGILLQMNLTQETTVPWSLAPVAIWLFVAMKWLGGWGFPAGNGARRADLLRAGEVRAELRRPVWLSSVLLAVVIISMSILSYGSQTMDFSQFGLITMILDAPPGMALGSILAVAVMSGLIEEAAFRGYMQRILEERYSPAVSIAIVAVMFAVVHPQAPVFVVVFAIGASGWGIVAYLGGSIRPLIVIHALVDLASITVFYFHPELLNTLANYDWTQSGMTPTFAVCIGLWVVAALAFVWSALRLARVRASLEGDVSLSFDTTGLP
jgi:membrane protease YdiL (CAAX protease family)